MIRFFTRCVWDLAADLGYEWVMRMDEESLLHSEIGYNLFDFMALRGLEYAFRQTAWEHGFTKNQFHTFVQAYITQDNIAPLWLLDQCDQPKSGKAFFSMRRCGELYGFYNNFFISKVSFWHKPEVQRFLDHIDREGVIYTLRWNDILWQSTAVQMFMPRRQVRRSCQTGLLCISSCASPPGDERAWLCAMLCSR